MSTKIACYEIINLLQIRKKRHPSFHEYSIVYNKDLAVMLLIC